MQFSRLLHLIFGETQKNFAVHILYDYGRICEYFDVGSLRRRIRPILFLIK